jgi:tetratricopeptide (TPR) repeat protein
LALRMFQNALNDDPSNAIALNNICATHNKMRQFKQATQACRKSLELSPNFTLAKNNLAWAERELAAIKRRAREQEIAALRNKDAQVFLAVGHTYYKIGDFSSSLESWQQALSLEPQNPIHSNNVAIAMIALKKYEQAIQMLDAALAIAPEENLYKNNRRWAQSLLDGEQN